MSSSGKMRRQQQQANKAAAAAASSTRSEEEKLRAQSYVDASPLAHTESVPYTRKAAEEAARLRQLAPEEGTLTLDEAQALVAKDIARAHRREAGANLVDDGHGNALEATDLLEEAADVEEEKYGYKNALWLNKSRDLLEAVQDDDVMQAKYDEAGRAKADLIDKGQAILEAEAKAAEERRKAEEQAKRHRSRRARVRREQAARAERERERAEAAAGGETVMFAPEEFNHDYGGGGGEDSEDSEEDDKAYEDGMPSSTRHARPL